MILSSSCRKCSQVMVASWLGAGLHRQDTITVAAPDPGLQQAHDCLKIAARPSFYSEGRLNPIRLNVKGQAPNAPQGRWVQFVRVWPSEIRWRLRRLKPPTPAGREGRSPSKPPWTFPYGNGTMETRREQAMSPTDERGESDRPEAGRRGCRITRWELLVVAIVIGVLLALLLPAIQLWREASRRMACQANLRNIGIAIHNYTQAQRLFPPGTVCVTPPTKPGRQYDVWKEAAETRVAIKKRPGPQGTSLLLRIEPFTDSIGSLGPQWNWYAGISNSSRDIQPFVPNSNMDTAVYDIKGFYCPSRRSCSYYPDRRSGLRPQDHVMMLSPEWTGGGTDYGGCAGRHAAFSLTTGYNQCDATMHYDPEFVPAPITKANDTPDTRWGIFGRVNVSTKVSEILDGTSNTIMTGELQRITEGTPTSKDGWVIGGPATLFTTGAMFRREGTTCKPVSSPSDGTLMNNGFFGSPGSDHPGGANFGMADGSVPFFPTSIDPNVFALLGSMADGAKIEVPK